MVEDINFGSTYRPDIEEPSDNNDIRSPAFSPCLAMQNLLSQSHCLMRKLGGITYEMDSPALQERITIRMTSEMIARIDARIADQSGYVSRQDAVRHCVDSTLRQSGEEKRPGSAPDTMVNRAADAQQGG